MSGCCDTYLITPFYLLLLIIRRTKWPMWIEKYKERKKRALIFRLLVMTVNCNFTLLNTYLEQNCLSNWSTHQTLSLSFCLFFNNFSFIHTRFICALKLDTLKLKQHQIKIKITIKRRKRSGRRRKREERIYTTMMKKLVTQCICIHIPTDHIVASK